MEKKIISIHVCIWHADEWQFELIHQDIADLLNLDEKFVDEYKILLLLNSIPNEYDHLTIILLYKKDNVTSDVVCSVLYNSEIRKKKDHINTVVEVLTTKGTS